MGRPLYRPTPSISKSSPNTPPTLSQVSASLVIAARSIHQASITYGHSHAASLNTAYRHASRAVEALRTLYGATDHNPSNLPLPFPPANLSPHFDALVDIVTAVRQSTPPHSPPATPPTANHRTLIQTPSPPPPHPHPAPLSSPDSAAPVLVSHVPRRRPHMRSFSRRRDRDVNMRRLFERSARFPRLSLPGRGTPASDQEPLVEDGVGANAGRVQPGEGMWRAPLDVPPLVLDAPARRVRRLRGGDSSSEASREEGGEADEAE